jgi:hypothetical protein
MQIPVGPGAKLSQPSRTSPMYALWSWKARHSCSFYIRSRRGLQNPNSEHPSSFAFLGFSPSPDCFQVVNTSNPVIFLVSGTF